MDKPDREREIAAHNLLVLKMVESGVPAEVAHWIADMAEAIANRTTTNVGRYLAVLHNDEPPPILTNIAVLALLRDRLDTIEAEIRQEIIERGGDPEATRNTFDLSSLQKRQDAGLARA